MKSPLIFFCQSFLFILALLQTACGSQQNISRVKDYVLYVDSNDPNIKNTIRTLIDQFNVHACFPALSYTDTREEATSLVTITSGLEKRDGKVGWGQWERKTFEKNPLPMSGQDQIVTFTYTMSLEFDKDYITKRMNTGLENDKTDLLKLFSHEAGHGLEKGHNNADPADLMYPDISGEKDLSKFFRTIAPYFNDSTAAEKPHTC